MSFKQRNEFKKKPSLVIINSTFINSIAFMVRGAEGREFDLIMLGSCINLVGELYWDYFLRVVGVVVVIADWAEL